MRQFSFDYQSANIDVLRNLLQVSAALSLFGNKSVRRTTF